MIKTKAYFKKLVIAILYFPILVLIDDSFWTRATWQIFKLEFPDNEASDQQILLFLFELPINCPQIVIYPVHFRVLIYCG